MVGRAGAGGGGSAAGIVSACRVGGGFVRLRVVLVRAAIPAAGNASHVVPEQVGGHCTTDIGLDQIGERDRGDGLSQHHNPHRDRGNTAPSVGDLHGGDDHAGCSRTHHPQRSIEPQLHNTGPTLVQNPLQPEPVPLRVLSPIHI